MIAGIQRYQDLGEHVCDPNGEPRPKAYWGCDCPDSKDVFWDLHGGIYGDVNYNKFRLDRMSAINSWDRKQDRSNAREKMYKKFHILWLNTSTEL